MKKTIDYLKQNWKPIAIGLVAGFLIGLIF